MTSNIDQRLWTLWVEKPDRGAFWVTAVHWTQISHHQRKTSEYLLYKTGEIGAALKAVFVPTLNMTPEETSVLQGIGTDVVQGFVAITNETFLLSEPHGPS